jgi:hypothetical protein
LAFDDLPLQVKENYVPRGFGAGVDVVLVAGHRASFAGGALHVYSVLEEVRYCTGLLATGSAMSALF